MLSRLATTLTTVKVPAARSSGLRLARRIRRSRTGLRSNLPRRTPRLADAPQSGRAVRPPPAAGRPARAGPETKAPSRRRATGDPGRLSGQTPDVGGRRRPRAIGVRERPDRAGGTGGTSVSAHRDPMCTWRRLRSECGGPSASRLANGARHAPRTRRHHGVDRRGKLPGGQAPAVLTPVSPPALTGHEGWQARVGPATLRRRARWSRVGDHRARVVMAAQQVELAEPPWARTALAAPAQSRRCPRPAGRSKAQPDADRLRRSLTATASAVRSGAEEIGTAVRRAAGVRTMIVMALETVDPTG